MSVTAGPDLRSIVHVDRRAASPLHRQLYDGLRRAILDGLLRAGERVPATRAFAAELGVSRLTVLTAYEQLLHEGYLDARAGSGTYVSASLPDDSLQPAGALSPAPRSARPSRAGGVRVATATQDTSLRPFHVGLPALDAFPRAQWARLVARRARTLAAAQMAYGDPAGIGVLRTAIAAHLRTARGVRCEAHQIVVVSGSQAALRLCSAVILAPGDAVAIEEPGYPGVRAAIAAARAAYLPVPVDAEGIDVARLDAMGDRVRAVYVTPAHQFPLGVSMSAVRRLALLDWARRRGAWILEDDYDSEYRYVSRPLGALQGMEPAAGDTAERRVIYVGTFSKVMFPALRVGYVVVPDALHDAFIVARQAADLFPSSLYQLALADFLTEGHFARHLRRMRTTYLGRRGALLDGLAEHCEGLLAVQNADAGLHVTTRLAEGMDDREAVRRMTERGLGAMALSACYVGDGPQHGLLLGFGGSREPTLRRSTRALGEVLRATRAHRPSSTPRP